MTAGPEAALRGGEPSPTSSLAAQPARPSPAVTRFLARHDLATPCLVMELDVVVRHLAELRTALPEAAVHYAVKANPEPEVVAVLAEAGASFDVASPAEIDLCLRQGVAPSRIS